MKTTTWKPRHSGAPTIKTAAEFMRQCWKRYLADKDKPAPEKPKDGPRFRPLDLRYRQRDLREDLRDCGWRLYELGRDKALHEAHDLAIKGMKWPGEGHDFSRQMDWAFDGIGYWMV